MHTVHFSLSLPRDEIIRWYRGEAHVVVVHTEEGLRIQLPARNLRPFVTPDGVSGRFALRFGSDGKLLSLRRAKPSRRRRVI